MNFWSRLFGTQSKPLPPEPTTSALKLPRPSTPIPKPSQSLPQGTVTDCKMWQCPKCKQVCVKSALGTVWFPGESLDKVHGTGSCPCGADFPQAEIYGGKYDFRGPRPKEQPASRNRPAKLNIIVFWKGMVPPSNPLGYCQQIVDGKYGEPSVRIDAWRMAGTKNTVDVTEAAALYRMYKNGGQMPDFGDPKDEVEGKGPDGNDIVAFFFWLG